jgi:hypothetical protein
MGAISNITKEGFAPSGFHAFPSTLRIDHYSGDSGPGLFGHAVNTGTYLVDHLEFGGQAFGGNRTVDGGQDTDSRVAASTQEPPFSSLDYKVSL